MPKSDGEPVYWIRRMIQVSMTKVEILRMMILMMMTIMTMMLMTNHVAAEDGEGDEN